MNVLKKATPWILVVFLGCCLMLQSTNIVKLAQSITIENSVVETKPSYDYLRSVTVFIKGKAKVSSKFLKAKYEEWNGTGIIVKKDKKFTYILTNAHVAGKYVKGQPLIYIEKKDGSFTLAKLIKMHDVKDLALLKIKGTLKEKKSIKGIATAKPQDKIYMVGHNLGHKYTYGEGVFAGYDGTYNIIQIPTAFGNSGSGVFDKNSNLVSMVFAVHGVNMFYHDLTHGLCIDSSVIESFLKDHNINF